MAKMFKAPPTFLNHVVSPVRTFATASLALVEVKETAKHLGVTFNDIVLATAAGGLRELLLRYDGRADRPILASVPVATDRSMDRITGNEIGGLSVSLPVHIDDPLERVRLTSIAASRAKENYELMGPELQGKMMEYLPPSFAPALFRWQSKHAAHSPHHECRRLQRAGPARTRDISAEPSDRDLLDRNPLGRKRIQHDRLELRRPGGHLDPVRRSTFD
jgi:diacylglycerol O-acyltransferase